MNVVAKHTTQAPRVAVSNDSGSSGLRLQVNSSLLYWRNGTTKCDKAAVFFVYNNKYGTRCVLQRPRRRNRLLTINETVNVCTRNAASDGRRLSERPTLRNVAGFSDKHRVTDDAKRESSGCVGIVTDADALAQNNRSAGRSSTSHIQDILIAGTTQDSLSANVNTQVSTGAPIRLFFRNRERMR